MNTSDGANLLITVILTLLRLDIYDRVNVLQARFIKNDVCFNACEKRFIYNNVIDNSAMCDSGNGCHEPQRCRHHMIRTNPERGWTQFLFLRLIHEKPMHGYQIITKIRRSFGVYFGPSTIYPLLGTLEKKGYVKSEWNMCNERPRKVYKLTNEGQSLLNFTEDSLNFICQKIGTPGLPKETMMEESVAHTALRPLLKRIETAKPMI